MYAERFWRILVQSARILGRFRTGFIGKCSPVHFFWGSFDLAVTRFSGRKAPPFTPSGAVPNMPAAVELDAYSHECSSAGFWPGGQGVDYPAFYSYASPSPPGFASAAIRPAQAFWNDNLNQYNLPYDAVRTADEGADDLLRNADLALYRAKRLGRGRHALFEPAMHAAALERLELEGELRRALAERQLTLHYQPVLELATGRVCGVEALARWRHPARGMISPAA